MCKRFIEANIPQNVRVQVHYDNKTPGVYNTIAHLFSRSTDELLCTGVSICSAKDQPRRSIGRAIAVGRAMKNLYHGHRV